jgi:hypothetical protein
MTYIMLLHEDILSRLYPFLDQEYWQNVALVNKRTYEDYQSLHLPKSITSQEDLLTAIRKQYRIEDIKHTLKTSPSSLNWNQCLYWAAVKYKKSLIRLLLQVNADVEFGLQGACHGGHTDLITSMMSRGAHRIHEAFKRACYGGHERVVRMMISKGADNFEKGFIAACKGGKFETAKKILTICQYLTPKQLNKCLKYACEKNNLKIVLLLNRHDERIVTLESAIFQACYNGHLEMVRYLTMEFHKRKPLETFSHSWEWCNCFNL